MDVYTESTGMHRSTCTYISTKGMDVYRVTSMDESTVKMVVRGRKNVYDKYMKYKPIWYIVTDVVGTGKEGYQL